MLLRISTSFLCLAILAHSLNAGYVTEEFSKPANHFIFPSISLDIPGTNIKSLHDLRPTPLANLPHAYNDPEHGQMVWDRMYAEYEKADIAVFNIDHGGVLISHTKDESLAKKQKAFASRTIAALNANKKNIFVINTARNPYGVLKDYFTRAVGGMGTYFAQRFKGKWPDDVEVLHKVLPIPHAITDTVKAWKEAKTWQSLITFAPTAIVIEQNKDTPNSAQKEQELRELLTLINNGDVYENVPDHIRERPDKEDFEQLPRDQFIVKKSPYPTKSFYTISHQQANKGLFLKSQLEQLAKEKPDKRVFVLCMGDDVVDEDMFKIALQHPNGFAIRVATPEQLKQEGDHLSHAQGRLNNHEEANELLRAFVPPEHETFLSGPSTSTAHQA